MVIETTTKPQSISDIPFRILALPADLIKTWLVIKYVKEHPCNPWDNICSLEGIALLLGEPIGRTKSFLHKLEKREEIKLFFHPSCGTGQPRIVKILFKGELS